MSLKSVILLVILPVTFFTKSSKSVVPKKDQPAIHLDLILYLFKTT